MLWKEDILGENIFLRIDVGMKKGVQVQTTPPPPPIASPSLLLAHPFLNIQFLLLNEKVIAL